MISDTFTTTNVPGGEEYYKAFSTALTPVLAKFSDTTKNAKEKMQHAALKVDRLYDDIVADIEVLFISLIFLESFS